jgi:c-di-GMP-binding flagellar brake protein YcgR
MAKKQVAIIKNFIEVNLVKKLERKLESDWSLEFHTTTSLKNDSFKAWFKGGIIVIYALEQSNIKELKKYLDDSTIPDCRVIVLSRVINNKLQEALSDMGVDHIHLSTESPKAIHNTIDTLFMDFNPNSKAVINEARPLSISDDFWISESHSHIIKELENWNVYLIGPSPNEGSWNKSNEMRKENFWEFTPDKDDSKFFHPEKGTWHFQGEQPIQSGFHWHFKSQEPHLYYLVDGIVEIDKFKIDKSKRFLLLTRNSESALNKLAEIESSYYTSFIVKSNLAKIKAENQKIESPFFERIIAGFANPAARITQEKIGERDKRYASFTQNTKYFVVIESAAEKTKYLSAIVEQGSNDLILWTPQQKMVAKAKAIENAPGDYTIEFIEQEKGKEILRQLKDGEIKTVFARGNINDGSIFFDVKSSEFRLDKINMMTPDKMWRVQRRKYTRINVDGRKKMTAEFDLYTNNTSYTITAPIRNVGAGGIALFIDEIHVDVLHPNTVIKEVKFSLNSNPFWVAGQIKWTSDVRKKDQLQNFKKAIGIEFMYLPQADKELIENFVLEEIYKSKTPES